MAIQNLSSRAIIGRFFMRLEQAVGAQWIGPTSMMFDSDQESETYNWIGQSPAMREWVGQRQSQGFIENGLTVTNKHYESTLDLRVQDVRRDKTGQIMTRVDEFADRANSHWASLLSTLILNGAATVCYDGQFFFDTDHAEGDSGTQSNDITVDISTLPAAVHGVAAAPSVEEAQQTMLSGISQILGFVDDRAEPMNEGVGSFLVMVPTSLYLAFLNAVAMPIVTGTGVQRPQGGVSLDVVMNPRLTAADTIFVFATGGGVSPFIRQQETEVDLKVQAEGSQIELDRDIHRYGIDAWRNVAYGYWQKACLVQMV